jgi:hypothetical protein
MTAIETKRNPALPTYTGPEREYYIRRIKLLELMIICTIKDGVLVSFENT